MTNEVLVPEIPTESTLPALFPERPDWQALVRHFRDAEGKPLDGRALVDDDFGEAVIAELQEIDTLLKSYPTRLAEWRENKARINVFIPLMNANIQVPVQPLIDLGKSLDKILRLDEERYCADARAEYKGIRGAWDMEIDRRAEAARIALEQEQQRQAEALKAAAVQAAQTAGNTDEAAAIAAEPVIPASVSMEQAKQGLPQSPKGSTSSRVYKRTITNWELFFGWQHSAPQLAATAYTAQADGTYRLSFNSAQWKRSNMQIPGVKCEEDRQVSNRGK